MSKKTQTGRSPSAGTKKDQKTKSSSTFKAEDFIKVLTDYAKETTGEPQQTNNYQQEYIETYYNSESEGKSTTTSTKGTTSTSSARDAYIQATNEETYGVNPETFGQAYHSPEAQGSWIKVMNSGN